MNSSSGIQQEEVYDRATVFWITLAVFVPLATFFESMKQLSYVSLVALASISTALVYILCTDYLEIKAS
jgi:VIT1/CCC1 family predicted Fe2+/Mn2+ transporter